MNGVEKTARKSTAPRGWHTIAQGGAWLAAVILAFVVSPPAHTLAGQQPLSWGGLTRFLVVIVNGLGIIATLTWAEKIHLRRWVVTCVAATVGGFVVLAIYGSLMLPWTCETKYGRLIAGASLTTQADKYRSEGHATCAQLLDGFANDPLLVWSSESIFWREVVLGWLFVLAIAMLALGVIALLQAHKIAQRRGARGKS